MTNNIDVVLDQAYAAYNRGHLEKAEALCRDVLAAEPTQGDALLLLGLIAYRSGALEPAAELLYQAVKLYPDIDNYRLTLASVLQRQGRLNEALTMYQQVAGNPQGLAQQGLILLDLGRIDDARQAFHQALNLDPDLPEARLGLALMSGDMAELQQVAVETHLPDAWYYLARRQADQGQNDLADQALQHVPVGVDTYDILRAILSVRHGNREQAEKIYQDILKRNPYRAEVWCNLADIYRDKGEYAAAEEYYKRALAQNKDDAPARQNLADLLVRQNRLAEALEEYRVLIHINPNDILTLYNLATVLERTGNLEDAAGLYFKVLFMAHAPKETEWRIADALTALAERDKSGRKLAMDFAQGWVKNQPNNPVAGHTLAALTGAADPNMTEYVKRLYDAFADTYDNKMAQLRVTAMPEIIALLPEHVEGNVLDLGCGTGLFGRLMTGRIQHLTGVDISPNMIEHARQTGAYHSLITDEVIHFLSQHDTMYSLIIGVEIIPYLSEIDVFFEYVFKHLLPGGLFALSVEITAESEPILALSGRYVYPRAYITDSLRRAGFRTTTEKQISLRREGTGFADGLIVVAQK